VRLLPLPVMMMRGLLLVEAVRVMCQLCCLCIYARSTLPLWYAVGLGKGSCRPRKYCFHISATSETPYSSTSYHLQYIVSVAVDLS
jgi:hypothetical protein